jgi:crossover junction endodeoxyribonuclease RuvC
MVKIKTNKIIRCVGIDPGKSGGIATIDYCLDTKREIEVTAVFMPSTDLDLLNHLLDISSAVFVLHAFVEQVHSMPSDGHAGAFAFGMNYGKLLMALTAAKIPYEFVQPRKWQAELGIVARVKDEPKKLLKERCRVKAQQLFPTFSLWSMPKTKGAQLSVCDAMLIAMYTKRKRVSLQ